MMCHEEDERLWCIIMKFLEVLENVFVVLIVTSPKTRHDNWCTIDIPDYNTSCRVKHVAAQQE